jgi:hypothetical protein
MEPQTLPKCPQCKQTDQIQKVTATYGANTEEWYETSSSPHRRSQVHHEAHTSLGLKLQPPPQPAGPTHPGLWYGIVAVLVLVVVGPLCSVALIIPLPFILGFIFDPRTLTAALPNIQGMPGGQVLVAVIGGAVLCVGLIGLGVIIWLVVFIKRRFDRDLANYKSKKAIFDEEESPRWQRAKERWEQLYYCLRDDTVFIPAENRAIHAADMEKYLYDPYFRG